MLRYKTKTRSGLGALCDIRPGNGAGQFLQPRSPHAAVSGDYSRLVWIPQKAPEENPLGNVEAEFFPALGEVCSAVLQVDLGRLG